MIFFDGLLYRLSLKTAVLLRVHLQYYPYHMMPMNRIPFLSGTKENVFISIWLPLLAFGCTLSFNRRCLQKFLHHLQSSFIIIFIHHHLLHSKTNTNTCVHTYFLKICYFRDVYWRFTQMYSPLSSCHRIIVMSSNHRHHLPHTLKQTQYFVFIHIQQYVILEVFCRITFR